MPIDGMRSAFLFLMALLSIPGSAAAQTYPVTFELERESESDTRQLEVLIDSQRVCTTPCTQPLLPGWHQFDFSFDEHEHELERIDVHHAMRLQVRWLDRNDIRLAGDVVLIVGVTLGALLGGTVFASYQEGDDGLLVLGSAGLGLMGLSLAVGIPMSIFDDAVERVR